MEDETSQPLGTPPPPPAAQPDNISGSLTLLNDVIYELKGDIRAYEPNFHGLNQALTTLQQRIQEAARVKGSLVFQGSKQPTDPAPDRPDSGDVWVMSQAGVMASSWIGVAGQDVIIHEMVVFNGNNNEWEFLGAAASAGVQQIKPEAPITASGTDVVRVGITAASTQSPGAVQLDDTLNSKSQITAATAAALGRVWLTATQASQAANSAETKAGNASVAAATAQQTADTAKSEAGVAQTTATNARQVADAALPKDGGNMNGMIDFAPGQGLPLETLPELPGSHTEWVASL